MDSPKVCILSYGSGNVKSVYNLLRLITKNVKVSNKPKDIRAATHLILPGVGAFGAAMKKIRAKLPLKTLEEEVFKHKKPFLGICVGMQVLADTGHEFGEHKGLGWIPGKVVKINSKNLPLPHMGWNSISVKKSCVLVNRFDKKSDFYCVHSYIFKPSNRKHIIATTKYQESFCSIINKENIYGVQFHPEKSQKVGRMLLENFIFNTK